MKKTEPWRCLRDHTNAVSCVGCGWTIMDERVFTDTNFKPIAIKSRINHSQIWHAEGRESYKVTEFWIGSTKRIREPPDDET